MPSSTLTLWNLLAPSELAAMLMAGMLPSELPAGFENRRQRLMAAYSIVQQIIAEVPKLKASKPVEIAVSTRTRKPSNHRPVVTETKSGWPSISAAARALKVRRATVQEILKANDNGERRIFRGHLLRHAPAA